MKMQRMPIAVVILGLVGGLGGCSSPPRSPVAPTTPAATVLPAPSVTSLSGAIGSTGGATAVTIVGSALATSVAFGGVTVEGTFDGRYPGAQLYVYTPAHAAGIVDVVVRGQNGESVTLPDAFTYAPPETFDFNGAWFGMGNNGQDTPIRFTIRDDLILGATCETYDDAYPGTPRP